MTFVLSSENLNDYGYRVLTAGIDVSDFEKNPVMMYNHHRSKEYGDNKLLPIGKWENLRKEGGRLLADAVFDDDDKFAAKVKRKVEKGMLNTASIHFRFIEISEDPVVMLQGQQRPTVTRSKLKEASIADIPGNADCYKLSYQGKTLMLSADTAPDELNNILPLVSHQKEDKMDFQKMTAAALGMGEDASSTQVLAKLTELNNKTTALAAENNDLRTQLQNLQKEKTDNKAVALVDAALSAGKITEQQKPTWLKLAGENFEDTKAALDGMQAYKSITSQLRQVDTGSSQDELVKRYDQLDKEGKLASLPEEERNLLVAAKTKALRESGKAKV